MDNISEFIEILVNMVDNPSEENDRRAVEFLVKILKEMKTEERYRKNQNNIKEGE